MVEVADTSTVDPKAKGETDASQLQVIMGLGAQELHEHASTTLEKAFGRTLPQMEVRFKDLNIAADVIMLQKDSQDATASLPTLANVVKKSFTKFSLKKQVVRKQILNKVSGVFKPGTITLVLGQPGSGKSSLMKILSGRFPIEKNVVVEGEITFNGKLQKDIKKQLPQFVSYVNQRDKHFPMLTVKETLDYAHVFCGRDLPKHAAALLAKGAPEERKAALDLIETMKTAFPDIIIQQMGLQTCQDTIVGNAMVRGISGGQRKRVTTAEMQFGHKNVLIMDEISTGLDSAATFDIVNTQRSLAKKLRRTIVISLLQPSPEVFALFDNVLILNDGHVMYHGPRESIVDYFTDLGFVCPPRRDVADYLLDLGTEQQAQYQVSMSGGPRSNLKHPREPSEFGALFRQSEIFQQTLNDLAGPIDPVYLDDMKDFMDHRPAFPQSIWGNIWWLMKRQTMITGRNTAFIKGRVVMVVIMGLLYGSTFYQFSPANAQVVMGMIFSAVLFLSLGQASQIPTIMEARDIFYKQRGANFYRTFAYVLGCSVSSIPMAILETVIFGSTVYWMCGFVTLGSQFGIFELMLFLTNMTFYAFFFFLSALSPDLHIAKPLSMIFVLLFVLFAGFVISKDQLPDYVVWIYWINPIAWCVRSLAVNQYRSHEFEHCVYEKVDYCAKYGFATSGEYFLSLFGVPDSKDWIGFGILFLIVSYFVCMFIAYLVLEFKRYETTASNASVTKIDVEEQAQEMERRNTAITISAESGESGPNGGIPGAKRTSLNRILPVTLAFDDLWYSVPDPKDKKQDLDLLRGVTGYASPGTMTALMGSSGAGKTTLMDVIAGRKTGGKIRGRILLNGYPATELAIRRSTGYCEQMDIHSDAATFREALTFSAFLRQGTNVSDELKYDSVRECLDLLDLNSIADKIIRGSSVEQMKRLTIGVELAAQPSVLFLDEPTSGLDARSAKVIMDGARKVADTGRTIVCTIHQPSTEVFLLFDRLLLLKRGGETVFNGEVGTNCCKLIEHFESIPGVVKIAPGYNPATWMLECIGAGVNSGSSETNFAEIYSNSELKKIIVDEMDKDGVTRPLENLHELTFEHKFAANMWTQMTCLVQRFTRMYWRTASYNLTRMGVSIFLAVLFGIIYIGNGYSTYTEINGAVGMIFLTTLFNGIVSFNSVLPISSEERASFYREQASQMYHPFWYFIGSTVAEIPYVFVCTLLFTVIFFPMVGFIGFTNGVIYWLTVALIVLCQTYMGQFLAYALPSVEVAAILGVLLNSICFLFAGFNPPAASIPEGYKWVYTIVPHRYAVASLFSLVLGHCPHANGTEVGCKVLGNAPATVPSGMRIDAYIEKVFGAYHKDIPRNFGVLIAFIVAFRILAFLSLRYINHTKR